MELLKSLVVILLSSVLVNNYVLSRFLGICPFLGVSKKLDQATGMGIAVTAVMLLATAVTWPIQYFLLDRVGRGYMQTATERWRRSSAAYLPSSREFYYSRRWVMAAIPEPLLPGSSQSGRTARMCTACVRWT